MEEQPPQQQAPEQALSSTNSPDGQQSTPQPTATDPEKPETPDTFEDLLPPLRPLAQKYGRGILALALQTAALRKELGRVETFSNYSKGQVLKPAVARLNLLCGELVNELLEAYSEPPTKLAECLTDLAKAIRDEGPRIVVPGSGNA